MVLKFVAFLLFIYLVLIVTLFLGQRKLLYFPAHNLPTEQFLQSEDLQYWKTQDDYYGFISIKPQKKARGTIIVFHGNAGTAHNRNYYSRALTPRGYRVLLAEYPGYGDRKGKPGETAFVADARKIVREIHEAYGEPIYLWGESLGSGVVAATVADSSLPVSGIVLITPWDSLANLARSIYWYFPVRWLLLDKYNSVKNLQSYKGNVAILIAQKDEVIPPKFALNLYESVASNKKLWTFDNAGHNNFPIHHDAYWWQEVLNFISK